MGDFTSNLYIQPKPRQAIKTDPTDDAHTTTHQPPTVASPNFMMGYDQRAGSPKMKSDMKETQDISDSVPRGN